MGRYDDDDVEIDHDGVERDNEDDDAVLYRFAEGLKWVPRSLIRDEGSNSVTVPEWWAEKEGLI